MMKKKAAILLIFMPCVVIFLISIFYFIDSRPEQSKIKEFLLKNAGIENVFGKVINVEYIRNGSSVLFTSSEINGETRYKIIGAKKKGFVIVYWKHLISENSSCIEKILFNNFFEEKNIIPLDSNEEKCFIVKK